MDARIFSESPPTNIYTGRIWIKGSTATAYMRLGSTWVSLGSAGDLRTYKRIAIWIDGKDVTSLVGTDSLTIADILTREVDTCTFLLIDDAGTNKPQVGQEILVFYRETIGATPVLRFAGLIDEMPQEQFSKGKYLYEITATDYTQELNRKLVVAVYENKTAGYIIKDIINTYAFGLGTYFVQDGINVDYISFNYKYPLECIEEICELIAYDFYVDYERNVHFFSSSTNDAPYSLTEAAGSGEYKNLVVSVNKSELKNAIIVRGGYEFSALYTQRIVADGIQESFPIRYKPFAPISVFVDTGSGYVAKTLGIDNIATSGVDFVINISEEVIKNLEYGILSSGDKIKITYKYKKPILAYVDDETSIALMKEYEGGDGIHHAPLLVDNTIETKAQARARGQAELSMYANPLVEGTFSTTQYGYRSGQIVTINIPTRGITSKQYLIQNVSAVSLGMGKFEYTITFATTLKGLIDYLIQLHKDSRKVFERTDEILDRLKIMPDESLTINDSVPIESRRNTTTDPYRWSNDAETTPGKGKWNLASWG